MGQATAMGAMVAPAWVGVPPRTPCTKSGTKVSVASKAPPMSVPAALATAMTRLENSVRGKIGSGARRSTTTNRPAKTTAAGNAHTAREPRAPTNTSVTAVPSNRAPPQSSGRSTRSTFS